MGVRAKMARVVLLLCVVVGVLGEEGDSAPHHSSGGYTCSPCHSVECDVLHQGVAAVRCVPGGRVSYVMVWVIRNLELVEITWTASTSRSLESLSVYAERVNQSAAVMGSPMTPLAS